MRGREKEREGGGGRKRERGGGGGGTGNLPPVLQPTPPLHRLAVHASIAKGAGCATPIPAAAKMGMFVARQIIVALARALDSHRLLRNLDSGDSSVLHSRLLARGLLLLDSRRLLDLLAACVARLGWGKGREGRQNHGRKRKGRGVECALASYVSASGCGCGGGGEGGCFPIPSGWFCVSQAFFPIATSFFNFFPNLKFGWMKLARDLLKYRIRCIGLKCAKSYKRPPHTSKPSSGRFFTVAGPRKL
jgi:hypothetical protein